MKHNDYVCVYNNVKRSPFPQTFETFSQKNYIELGDGNSCEQIPFSIILDCQKVYLLYCKSAMLVLCEQSTKHWSINGAYRTVRLVSGIEHRSYQ